MGGYPNGSEQNVDKRRKDQHISADTQKGIPLSLDWGVR